MKFTPLGCLNRKQRHEFPPHVSGQTDVAYS